MDYQARRSRNQTQSSEESSPLLYHPRLACLRKVRRRKATKTLEHDPDTSDQVDHGLH